MLFIVLVWMIVKQETLISRNNGSSLGLWQSLQILTISSSKNSECGKAAEDWKVGWSENDFTWTSPHLDKILTSDQVTKQVDDT